MANYEISYAHPFVNPYNFVPVNLQETKRTDVTSVGKGLTGYMVCHMKAKTYLAVPDVANKQPTEIEKHFKYPFIGAADGTPYIPASSVRGVVRNVYETMTDSCFGTMKKDTVITVRTKNVLSPGLLVKKGENWVLYRAKRHLVVTDPGFYEDHHLKQYDITLYKQKKLINKSGNLFKYELAYKENGEEAGYTSSGRNRRYIGTYVKYITETENECGLTGYLCIGEKSPRRHFQSIFEKRNIEGLYKTISKKDLEKLETVLEIYRNDSVNKQYPNTHKGYPDYERMKQNGVIPVYYQIQNGKLYMSFAALGRKAFSRMLNDVVSEKSHQKCDTRENLCPACALFGTVEGEGLGSRIRFTDACCTNYEKERLVENVVFGELGSPRMSYLPFYLKARDKTISYKDGYDTDGLEIRGRKFYWHHEPELVSEQEIPINERNATFDVLNSGTEFKFTIYFDGISETQLKQLAAAVHLNDNNRDGNQCHKIGHGKPFGYGSVKITVDRCMLREFNLNNGWRETPYNLPEDEPVWNCSEETKEALKIISDFTACECFGDVKVEYPGIVTDELSDEEIRNLKRNDSASHRWFTENYKVGDPRPKYELPEIKKSMKIADGTDNTENSSAETAALFKYKIIHDRGSRNGNRVNHQRDTRRNDNRQQSRNLKR